MPFSSKSLLHRLVVLPGLLLLLLPITGCPGSSEEDTEVSVAEALAFEPLGRGRQAEIDTTELVIRDAATWTAYQDSLRPLMPFEGVNFEQEMVVLAALPVTTGGYDLRIEIIEKIDAALTVRYRLFIPGEDCRVTMGDGVVFQAVRLAQTDGPLRFERDEEILRCTDPR